MKWTKPVAGQKLWFVPNDRSPPREVTVEKVGRVWFTFDRFRFEVETGKSEKTGYGSNTHGMLWPSREVYEESLKIRRAWFRFAEAVDRLREPPDYLTIDNINEARAALGLDPDENV